jgi:ribonucleoside-diphosphate reductase subunit M2
MFSYNIISMENSNPPTITPENRLERPIDAEEEILKENPNRFVLFPIRYKDIWQMYKKMEACFWTAEEIDFSKDLEHWEKKLTSNERYFIERIIAFFAGSDGIVLENLMGNFCNEVQVPEARCVYGFQAMIENIHSETYSLLIDKYIRDETHKNYLFNAINNIPAIKKKADWAIKWMDSKVDGIRFAHRLVAFSIVEGVFFSGAFCAIYWLKQRGLMPGLTFSNELISRDEGMHTDFAVLLYSHLTNKLTQTEVENIVKEAVEIEKEFILESIPCNMIGMNRDLMSQYIEYVADRLMKQLGYDSIWKSSNPFDFMELISMETKTNFFEKKVAEYSMAKVETGDKNNKIEFNVDF